MKKLPKFIADPPCTGCRKRKEFLLGLAAKGRAKARELMARSKPGSNAARRVIRKNS